MEVTVFFSVLNWLRYECASPERCVSEEAEEGAVRWALGTREGVGVPLDGASPWPLGSSLCTAVSGASLPFQSSGKSFGFHT